MKHILILSTGGTISSVPSKNGLIPADKQIPLEKLLIEEDTIIHVESLLVLDSSNIQPEEWTLIAQTLFEKMKHYQGIIVTHGTDTMAYTASMMSFMIQNPSVPIVFTGSQLPLNHPLTDALDNLKAALAMAKSSYNGIFLAFDRKIMFASRAVKVRTSSFSAFESINLNPVGRICSSGLSIDAAMIRKTTLPPSLHCTIDTNVFLLKLTPATDPAIISLLIQSGIHGIVIEAYGAGGIPFQRRDFTKEIQQAILKNIPVVVTSQCLYERSNFNIYEVGTKVLKTGAIEALDMTTEAAVTKLMYALGKTKDLDHIKQIFYTPLANEISLK